MLDRANRTDARHRGLRAVIASSYGLLDAMQQAVFDRLGVFAGGFLAETAYEVCAEVAEKAERFDGALGGLVERSMVRAEIRLYGKRYSLLETMRHFACDRLEREGRLDGGRDRHAAALGSLVERAQHGLWGPDEPRWAAILDDERANMVTAHRWLVHRHDHDSSLRPATGAYLYAWPRGRSEIRDLAQAAIAAIDESPMALPAPSARALAPALGVAADSALSRGDLATAKALVARGLDVARAGEPGAAALCLAVAGDLALFAGRSEEAATRYQESSDQPRTAHNRGLAAWTAACLALAHAYGAQRKVAASLAREALAMADAGGCPSAQAFARYVMAEAMIADQPQGATEHLREALRIAEGVGAAWVSGLIRLSLATSSAHEGSVETALLHYRELIALWRRAGTWTQQWTTLRTLVALLARAGSPCRRHRAPGGHRRQRGNVDVGRRRHPVRRGHGSGPTLPSEAEYGQARARGAQLSAGETLLAAEAALDEAIKSFAE